MSKLLHLNDIRLAAFTVLWSLSSEGDRRGEGPRWPMSNVTSGADHFRIFTAHPDGQSDADLKLIWMAHRPVRNRSRGYSEGPEARPYGAKVSTAIDDPG
ncbi:hypothetical protein [Salipiger thiooxidans]|uniref:hypothetical protein n=1 Tax=Salipiger thiooxidans TaxID=282683 RepID=UPI001CD42029|nr:hypothetical protein [Salipiger thiooxidans]MCA0850675.1 hypothetical protein [Salipiger thiooxidans]